jgi:hypothetical protein
MFESGNNYFEGTVDWFCEMPLTGPYNECNTYALLLDQWGYGCAIGMTILIRKYSVFMLQHWVNELSNVHSILTNLRNQNFSRLSSIDASPQGLLVMG